MSDGAEWVQYQNLLEREQWEADQEAQAEYWAWLDSVNKLLQETQNETVASVRDDDFQDYRT